MTRALFIIFIQLMISNIATAQLGKTAVGNTVIGKDSFARMSIGEAQTPACLFPGSCAGTGPVYIFIGAGEWSIPGNWSGSVIPPAVLPAGSEIVIDPAGTSECLMNTLLQIISPGAKLTVMPNKKFRVPGELLNIK